MEYGDGDIEIFVAMRPFLSLFQLLYVQIKVKCFKSLWIIHEFSHDVRQHKQSKNKFKNRTRGNW